MKNRLKNVVVKFVSLVDSPAHPDARVVLTKAERTSSMKGTMPPEEVDPETAEAEEEAMESMNEGEEADEGEMGTEEAPAPKKKAVAKNENPVGMVDDVDSLDIPSGLRETYPEWADYILTLEDTAMQLSKRVSELEGSPVTKTGEEPDVEDVIKNADPEVRELLTKALERAEAAEAIAKAEREQRLRAEALRKAETLTGIAAPAQELADLIFKLREMDPELGATVEALLTKASDAVMSSPLFKSLGADGAEETDPAEALAKSIAKEEGLTYEQAYAEALRRNPNLYSRGV